MNNLDFKRLVEIHAQALETAAKADVSDISVCNSLITSASIKTSENTQQFDRLDWTCCYVENIRFVAANFNGCSFDQVVFFGCDFSGVSFVNCLLRNCFFVNVKSVSHLSFSDCIVDDVVVICSKFDSFEVQDSKIGLLSFVELGIKQLQFQQCSAYKRSGLFSVFASELAAVGGLETLPKAGVKIQIDAELWRDLGDYYLKQKGFAHLASEQTIAVNQSLDQALHAISHG